MNYLKIVNKILIRLRESEVSNVNETKYSKLIGALVNEAKHQIESSWDWTGLRLTILGETVEGKVSYELNAKDQNNTGEQVLFASNGFKILSAFNRTEETELHLKSSYEFDKLYLQEDPNEGSPIYYTFNGISNDKELLVDVYPVPDDEYTLAFNGVIKTTDLVNNNDELLIPEEPVYLLALSYAIDERGEDNGQASAYALQRAKQSLNDAISFDANRYPAEITWEVC